MKKDYKSWSGANSFCRRQRLNFPQEGLLDSDKIQFYRAINGKLGTSHMIGSHARCFNGRQWLQQLRRYVLETIVSFIFVKISLRIPLQYFYDT